MLRLRGSTWQHAFQEAAITGMARREISLNQGCCLGTVDVLGQIILYYGLFPVHCRMFSNTPGHYLLDTNHSFPGVMTKKNVSLLPNVPGGRNHPWLRATALNKHDMNKNAKCAWTFKPKEPPQGEKKKDVCTQVLYCIGAELNVLATILILEFCINLSRFVYISKFPGSPKVSVEWKVPLTEFLEQEVSYLYF